MKVVVVVTIITVIADIVTASPSTYFTSSLSFHVATTARAKQGGVTLSTVSRKQLAEIPPPPPPPPPFPHSPLLFISIIIDHSAICVAIFSHVQQGARQNDSGRSRSADLLQALHPLLSSSSSLSSSSRRSFHHHLQRCCHGPLLHPPHQYRRRCRHHNHHHHHYYHRSTGYYSRHVRPNV